VKDVCINCNVLYKFTATSTSASTTTTNNNSNNKRVDWQYVLIIWQIARHIVACLGPFRRPDCEQGRINTTKDFKRLARKVFTSHLLLVFIACL